MPVTAIVFDKDGTLFDFQRTWGECTAAALARFSAGDARRLAELAEVLDFDPVTRTFRPESLVIAGTNEEMSLAMARVLKDWSVAEIHREIDRIGQLTVPVEAVPLAPLLTSLVDLGYPLGVATNDSEVTAQRNLDHCGIRHHFDFIAGADSGYGGKPDPGMLTAFARHTGVPEAEVAMVGDSLHDLTSGRAAGMITVAVLTGMAGEAGLAPFADHVLPDIAHLPGLLSGL